MQDSQGQDIKLGDLVYLLEDDNKYLATVIGENQSQVCLCFGISVAYSLKYPIPFTDAHLKSYVHRGFNMIGNIEEYFGEHIYWHSPSELTVANINNITNIRREKPCQVCSRMNDLGKTICWWCQNIP